MGVREFELQNITLLSGEAFLAEYWELLMSSSSALQVLLCALGRVGEREVLIRSETHLSDG